MLIKRFISSTVKCLPVTICSLCDKFIYCYECNKFTSCYNCNDNLFYRYCDKIYCNKYSGGVFEEEIKEIDLYKQLRKKDT